MVGSYRNFTLKPSSTNIKFLCSYGGKILPRYPDAKLRYHGGETRVLAVERSIPFLELLVKLEEMCGKSVSLKCQLPTEDLDALVSITSDEDLANLIEEYDLQAASQSATVIKIRAFLCAPKLPKKATPYVSTPSTSTSNDATSPKSTLHSFSGVPRARVAWPTSERLAHQATSERFVHQIPQPRVFPALCYNKKVVGKVPQYGYYGYGNVTPLYLVHNGNHWQ